LDKKNRSISDIEQALFVENKVELNKMIFHIFKNNKYIINIFNKNIYSQTDFYVLLSSLKVYLGIIGGSSDIEEALKKFPKYLFNERDIFIKLYSCLNKEKVKKIYNNIFKVENLVRKNSNLYFIIGLRFLINTKKIITS
jgi:hypothetical protein